MRQKAISKSRPTPCAAKLCCVTAVVISQLCLYVRHNGTLEGLLQQRLEKNGENGHRALPFSVLFSPHIMSPDTDKGCTICHRGDDLFGGGQLAGDRLCLRERALCVGLNNNASAHLQSKSRMFSRKFSGVSGSQMR